MTDTTAADGHPTASCEPICEECLDELDDIISSERARTKDSQQPGGHQDHRLVAATHIDTRSIPWPKT